MNLYYKKTLLKIKKRLNINSKKSFYLINLISKNALILLNSIRLFLKPKSCSEHRFALGANKIEKLISKFGFKIIKVYRKKITSELSIV